MVAKAGGEGSGGMGPDEWELETKVAKLERSLGRAVREERYSEATEHRDELSRLHIDDAGAVLAANADFYSAFTRKNSEKMASLWLRSEGVLCVHPGREPLIGFEAVVKAWKGMFSSGDAAFKASVVSPKAVSS
jgi:SnoaL-like domain/UvrB/uvrC motif